MPKKTKSAKSKNPYVIDREIFFDEWFAAVTSNPKKDMDEYTAIMQKKCDADAENKGRSKILTNEYLRGKMNYYRKSWELKMEMPATTGKSGGDRQKFQEDYMDKFTKAKAVDK